MVTLSEYRQREKIAVQEILERGYLSNVAQIQPLLSPGSLAMEADALKELGARPQDYQWQWEQVLGGITAREFVALQRILGVGCSAAEDLAGDTLVPLRDALATIGIARVVRALYGYTFCSILETSPALGYLGVDTACGKRQYVAIEPTETGFVWQSKLFQLACQDVEVTRFSSVRGKKYFDGMTETGWSKAQLSENTGSVIHLPWWFAARAGGFDLPIAIDCTVLSPATSRWPAFLKAALLKLIHQSVFDQHSVLPRVVVVRKDSDATSAESEALMHFLQPLGLATCFETPALTVLCHKTYRDELAHRCRSMESREAEFRTLPVERLETLREAIELSSRRNHYPVARIEGLSPAELSAEMRRIKEKYGAVAPPSWLKPRPTQIVACDLTLPELLGCLELLVAEDPTNIRARKTLFEWCWGTGHQLGLAALETKQPHDYAQAYPPLIAAIEAAAGLDDAEVVECYKFTALAFHLTGENEICDELMRQVIDLQQRIISNDPAGPSGIRFLQTKTGVLTNIGHLSGEPDRFIKECALGNRPPHTRGILLAPGERLCNRALADYWLDYFCIISDERLIHRMSELSKRLEIETSWYLDPETRRTHYHWTGAIVVQREWEKRGRAPLVKLKPAHIKAGYDKLEEAGIPRNSWFVPMHVRDCSNLPGLTDLSTNHRNAQIQDYFLAIKEVTDRGGWVIRMGDSSMRPLPPMPRVFDYARSKLKSDWMDLFLIAEGRFLLGSASGVNSLPLNFGTPSLLTNMSPSNGFGLCSQDVYIPRLLRSRHTGELLGFSSMLAEPFNYLCNGNVYEHYGVDVIPNTPEELRDAVLEMLQRTSGIAMYSDEDEALQAQFREITRQSVPNGFTSRIGRAFLRKYKQLLHEEAVQSAPGVSVEASARSRSLDVQSGQPSRSGLIVS